MFIVCVIKSKYMNAVYLGLDSHALLLHFDNHKKGKKGKKKTS